MAGRGRAVVGLAVVGLAVGVAHKVGPVQVGVGVGSAPLAWAAAWGALLLAAK